MTEYASFEDLTSGVVSEDDIPLPSGKTARVRGVSRYEYALAVKINASNAEVDGQGFEASIVEAGMVQPKLTLGQVIAWQKSPGSFADFGAAYEKIMEFSGKREGADKS